MPPAALIVIPTYNEALTIERAVSGAIAHDGIDVLVVDDASPDGTGALVERLAEADAEVTGRRRVHVLHRSGKAGLGAAYRAGLSWGLANGYALLGEMDADLSHDPADLPRLIAGTEHADLVIGSRYVPGGGVVDWPRRRMWLSRAGNRYVRLMTGLPLQDATAGFRMFRRSVLEAIDITSIRSDGYAFQVEAALRTWQAGFAILEVPIIFRERGEGVSKMSNAIVLEAVRKVAGWRREGRRHANPPTHPASVAGR